MLKIRLTYLDSKEVDGIVELLKEKFKVLNISKDYSSKGKSLYKKVYIDLSIK